MSGLRSEMQIIMETLPPKDAGELHKLLGRADEALRRSVYGIRNAKSDTTAWEVLILHRKIRRYRIELLGER